MKKQNPWRTTEIAILRDAFKRNPNVSPDELCELLPMHTRGSIDAKRAELGIERPGIPPYRPGSDPRYRPGWAAIAKLLDAGPRSRQELADALNCSRANIQQTLATMRGHWHVAGWRPTNHYSVMTPLIGIGAGSDAPYPRKARQAPRRSNPFLVAAGLVCAPQGAPGRVFRQATNAEDEEVAA